MQTFLRSLRCKLIRFHSSSRLALLVVQRNLRALIIDTVTLGVFVSTAHAQIPVTTYHYDTLRTGWNQNERTLTPANVSSSSFGLLLPKPVTLDDQVDAQPLVVPNVAIAGGIHEVVYVATENNTIYAIDPSTGAVLLSRNLGSPVPMPLGCTNNGPNVGINSTPVIDLASKTMYVIAYTLENNVPVYRIHALDLSTLADKVPPVLVSASHTLTNLTTFTFDARYQRQRPALLAANGNIYAGFGSFCDFGGSLSRGWLLGWKAGSLTPLAANRLNDLQPRSNNPFFLSAIWMSGYGISGDPAGNLYFVTGNSAAGTYDGATNIQESVVKVSPDLTTLLGLFTPSDTQNGVDALDARDDDFGSGGVLLLPDQSASSIPHLAVAAGKVGQMYLLNRDRMGGYLISEATGVGNGGRLQVVGLGASDGLPYLIWQDTNGRWNPFGKLPDPNVQFSTITTGLGNGGRLQVVGLGAADKLPYLIWQDTNGRWHWFGKLPDPNVQFSTITTGLGNGGRLQVVGLGAADKLPYLIWQDTNGSWHWFGKLPDPNVQFSAITAGVGNGGRLQVVGLSAADKLPYLIWQDTNGSWHWFGKLPDPSVQFSAITAGVGNGGRLQVVGLGAADKLPYLIWQDTNGSWHWFGQLPDPNVIPFSAVATGVGNGGRLQVVGLGASDGLPYLIWQDTNGSWHWYDLLPDPSGIQFSSITIGVGNGGRLQVVGLGADGRSNLIWQDTDGSWHWYGLLPDVMPFVDIGGCWCGQSYFVGADGVGRVVSSGGSKVIVWKVQTSPTVALVKESSSADLPTGQEAGFFTTVSSNSNQAGTAVIWAVSRPSDTNPANVMLFAFSAANGSTLFSATAGTWPNTLGNANIVPVVANGKVYVASHKQLTIFGLH